MPKYYNDQEKKIQKRKLFELLDSRGIEQIKIIKNRVFSREFLTEEYSTIEHVWSHGDKLYKLAHIYFGDRDLFWIIGLFNNKPTDSHYTYGDVVFIPNDYVQFIRDVVK
jgi:hypothetical protein